MRRRSVLLASVAGAGALLVGWAATPPRSRLGGPRTMPPVEGEVALNGWIKIAADGAVVLAMPYAEMGQGVHTGLAMLVAEELDVPLARVRLVEAGHDTLYGNVASFVALSFWFQPQHDTQTTKDEQAVLTWFARKIAREVGVRSTGASTTLADAWQPLRLAAATARGQLLGAAALRWRLPIDELEVRDGVVSHASGSRATYAELMDHAVATPPGSVRLKPREQWRLLGRPAPRIDVPAKSDGSARFGIDTRLPGLVYAAVRHAPALGGHPARVNEAPALASPGVLRVVRLMPFAGSDEALAVVGRTWWHARRGADALDVDWAARPAGALSSAAVAVRLEAEARAASASGAGFVFHQQGDARAVLEAAPRVVEAVYHAPFLAHAAMEPPNCTARVAGGKVEVWAPTQLPGLARELAARVAGVRVDDVTLHTTYLGGGFGRRLDIDVVGQAVRVALETGGAPVQLVWPREEDLRHDFYRPAAAALMRAALDDQGRVAAYAFTSAGDTVTARFMARVGHALAQPVAFAWPDRTASEGLFDLPYAVPNRRVAHVALETGVPVGYWRSVGHSHNAFFSESFVDELAHAARRDPVAFRLDLLRGAPRAAAVLKLAAERAGWGAALPAGRARGVALHESFGTLVAQVAEVSVDTQGIRVHRVVCALDCGTVVNPQLVAQQMESGIVFGLAAALHGRVDIVDGVVRQQNFPDLPLITLARTPVVETHIVPSTREPSGVGEPGVPPIAPAVANALFALSGKRIRALPLAV